MKKTTTILNTTPIIFASWLSKHTTQLLYRHMMIENGYVCLQRAQPPDVIGNPAKSEIHGFIVHELEDSDIPITDWLDFVFIQFDYIPLSNEWTEIICSCIYDQQSVLDYFDELMADIDRRWPLNAGASQPQEAESDRKIIDHLRSMPEKDQEIMICCARWASRLSNSTLDNMDEFLAEIEFDVGFIGVDKFKKLLREAGKLGLIRKEKRRWVPNCDLGELLRLL